jgi:hypothetical protein
VSKHVECTSGRRFSVTFLRPTNFGHAIQGRVYVDGRRIRNPTMHASESKTIIDRYNEDGPNGKVSKALQFGELVRVILLGSASSKELSEDGPRLDPSILDKLGKITVTFEAGTSRREPRMRTTTSMGCNYGPKAKKLLSTFVTQVRTPD